MKHDDQIASGEQCFRIQSPLAGLRLFLRRMPARTAAKRGSVLYVHGATFPSALSFAHRFQDRSWRDAVCDAGFDAWAFDFLGFGGSDRYPEMNDPADAHGPLGLARDGAQQVEQALRFIVEHDRVEAASLITHSWGSMPAALVASAHPRLVDRIVMFAPLAQRPAPRYTPRPDGPAWKDVTLQNQWDRFVEDVPSNEEPVLSRDDFREWGERYLDSDPESRRRDPPAVRTPAGPFVEILRAWHGELAWSPDAVTAPVAIVRGAWDGLCADADARWLFDALGHAREKRDIKIARGTHLMHLERMRRALWDESIAFLSADAARSTTTTRRTGDGPMQDHHEAKDLAGYDPGSPDVAKSPISLDELRDLKASALFTDEDVIYLRLSYDVLKDKAEDLVTMWRGIIAQHQHLARYSQDPKTGQPDTEYGAKVGKRFAQWVLDTARAEYDQEWLDYQYEIGLRHHRTKKNRTDGAHTTDHIRGRDLIAFAAATVAPMRPYLEGAGRSRETVDRMLDAWWKSMILQVTLWSQPYMNEGDF